MYVLVRTDIPLADQIVQVGHACLDAGFKFSKPKEVIHLVVVRVESENQLLEILEKAALQGLEFALFHEPDNKLGFTAACTKPLKVTWRREFRNLPLWKPPKEVTKI